ncbi:hypothetical protein LPUS_11962 [Lasallia pustulata]|uniref:Uncharacterized protein n=1 Tax=Lasallia pustulata TaxID=136370 RepID=A0A1W5DDR3_9LECA|nr:hypothetical protein LPUS_11962 [Lasallia pustulata]
MVDLHDTPSYTEGSSRVILTNDGTKACLALLLTDEMVSKINQISTLDRQVRALKGKFHDADCAASIAQMYLDESSDLINVTEEKMTKMEEKRDKTLKRKQQIADILTSYKNKLAFARDQLQERFEDALHGAGLFTSKPDDEIAVGVPDDSETQLQERFEDALHGAGLFTSKPDDEIAVEVPDDSETQLPKQMPGSTSYTDTTSITVEHQNRLAAYESMKERKEELQELQDIFDDREQRYDQEILNAEVSLEHAKSQVRALGFIGNAWDQESNFVDHPDDGYPESLEAALCGEVNRGSIEAWMTEVPEFQVEVVTDSQDEEGTVSQEEEGTVSRDEEGTVSRDEKGVEDQNGDGWDAETVEDQDGDEWDAKSVKMSDSISVICRGPNRRKIDRWQDICGL